MHTIGDVRKLPRFPGNDRFPFPIKLIPFVNDEKKRKTSCADEPGRFSVLKRKRIRVSGSCYCLRILQYALTTGMIGSEIGGRSSMEKNRSSDSSSFCGVIVP